MRKKLHAFTLVELLIVILIIGILATIAVISYQGASARARRAATIQTLNDFNKSVAVCVAGGGKLTLSSDPDPKNVFFTRTSPAPSHYYTAVSRKGKFICSDTDLTNTVMPNVDASHKLNGYNVAYGAGFFNLWIDNTTYQVVWGHGLDNTPTGAYPYPVASGNITNGDTAYDIDCTSGTCVAI